MLCAACAFAPAAELDREALIGQAAAAAEGTWRKVQKPPDSLSSREIFLAALAWCEANVHADRLAKMFETAAAMQDRSKDSRGYGNFRWSWGHDSVRDYNAVEFCMQAGAVIWLRHNPGAPGLPAPARKTLQEILDYAVQGCLRHGVRPGYTNVALMNAENLILLGEGLARPEVADEGYRRLGRFVLNTWECGICEYDSPTYYGVDLDCLLLIHRFASRPEGKAAAAALLELFWTDIAANWFQASGRLAGARSRDYDYLRGRGYLDIHLGAAGWLQTPARPGMAGVWLALADWHPPARLGEMARKQLPRLVRQSWGPSTFQFRTHYLCPDVTLSAAGANYGPMDLPLTVDLPGPADCLRGYFIPDARHDPYGKKKIPAGPHSKTLHLRPFWSAAQRRTDALGIVIYREADLRAGTGGLESHFVLPLDVDELWVGPTRPRIEPKQQELTAESAENAEGRRSERKKPQDVPLPAGAAFVLRKGTAAVGIRVPWSRGADGQAAPVHVVWDANPYRALRLTVTHQAAPAAPGDAAAKAQSLPGAALWVRIGSGLGGEEAFAKWRQDFAAAKCQADESGPNLAVNVQGADGPVSLTVAPAEANRLQTAPAPKRLVLEIDGKDVGREILKDVEPIRSQREALLAVKPVPVGAQGTYWEAEAGRVAAPMAVAKDASASGGAYVWCPGEPGERGPAGGHAAFRLQVSQAGKYYVWGRVQAPTPTEDSFYVRALADHAEPVSQADWHTGVHKQWEWTPIRLGASKIPSPLALPKGEVLFELLAREDGTKIDRLFITPDAKQTPR